MLKTIKTLAVACMLAATPVVGVMANASVAQAEVVDLAVSERPAGSVEPGDVGVLTFPTGSIPALVEVYGGGAIKRIVPNGNVVRFAKASERWFNWKDASGCWALSEDGPSYRYSSGIVTEPTRTYGGRAHDGAAFRIDSAK
ncbi:MAG: hypothetical protein HGA33_04880 [Candidatus Moranbacteria bacterium]|nr:hypothetical protein [Candidatus Moranbacteria bacterium]